MELVIFQDVNDVQESKFSRTKSFAMMHKSGEALKEDSGNPLIFVNISYYVIKGIELQVVEGGNYGLNHIFSV